MNADSSSGSKRYARVLTIAGSDSGGGAGIQADLKTFAALSCYGASAVTALTAQNTLGVAGIHPVPPAFVADQIEAVLSDIGADAVKIGMLYSAGLIETVAGCLRRHRAVPVVLDPVMVAQSGDRLLREDAVGALKRLLLPLATVTTPNLPEAAVLLGREVSDPETAARELAALANGAVLLKGGHSGGETSTDYLFLPAEDRLIPLPAPRVPGNNTHGTGCTLSSAIAAHLARGESVDSAVRGAKAFIHSAIEAGARYRLGAGAGPVHHFFAFWG